MRDEPVGRQGEANKKEQRKTERTTTFRAPSYMHHRIRSSGPAGTPQEDDFEAGFETWTVAYATPSGPGVAACLHAFRSVSRRRPSPRRSWVGCSSLGSTSPLWSSGGCRTG